MTLYTMPELDFVATSGTVTNVPERPSVPPSPPMHCTQVVSDLQMSRRDIHIPCRPSGGGDLRQGGPRGGGDDAAFSQHPDSRQCCFGIPDCAILNSLLRYMMHSSSHCVHIGRVGIGVSRHGTVYIRVDILRQNDTINPLYVSDLRRKWP